MMKNKKLMVVCVLAIAFLLVLGSFNFIKATDDIGDLPIIDTDNKPNDQTQTNAPTNTPAPITGNNTTNNGTSGNTLPQTGVAGDTALFVFIGVCIASAAYAYFRIKKYNVR